MESKEKITSPEEEMSIFRKEIQELKEKEEKRELQTAHFKRLNVEELVDEDREIWQKYKDDTLTLEGLNQYRTPIFKDDNNSRKDFAAFLGNKLMIREIEKEK